MKRLLSVLLFLFLAFTIYHDLTIGSLPISKQPPQEKAAYVDWLVQPGDTVLSIHEHLSHDKNLPISIEQIIKDFEKLNPATNASDIKIGHMYKFPIYDNTPDG